MIRFLIFMFFVFIALFPVLAQGQEAIDQPVINIDEQVIEKRARDVGRSLRCVVCQNQSIDESDATLAQDMRKLVREQIRAGQSNAEVVAYMKDRYGDFVLLKPPLQANTYILWFAPLVLFLVFLLWYMMRIRRRPQSVDATPLSTAEQAAFEKLSPNVAHEETDI